MHQRRSRSESELSRCDPRGVAGDTSVTDPNGNVTTYRYDDFGQMLRQTSPVTGETTYEYDDGGNLVRHVDARGAVTTRSYDALGRVLQSVTTGEGSSESIT